MASIPCNEATGHTEHAMHPQVQPLDPTDTGDICEGSIVTHSWYVHTYPTSPLGVSAVSLQSS